MAALLSRMAQKSEFEFKDEVIRLSGDEIVGISNTEKRLDVVDFTIFTPGYSGETEFTEKAESKDNKTAEEPIPENQNDMELVPEKAVSNESESNSITRGHSISWRLKS